MLIPSIVLAVLMLSFNLFGDGLRDALDPTMKEM
jgi:oligopeptide transport system permease protein